MEHFLAVRRGEAAPFYDRARALKVAVDETSWAVHNAALKELHAGDNLSDHHNGQQSLLDLKIDLATQLMDACDLCPHHCKVNRNQGERGYCGVGAHSAVHWEGILHGEELEVVPSHEVFFSGCTMRCAFCYSHRHITRPMSGVTMTPAEIARRAEQRQREGAANLNVVGGDPIVHIATILKALRLTTVKIPVVWNSNMYATPEAMALLDGIVDLYLGDIHFGNDDCARRLGKIPNYLPSITQAFAGAVGSGASVVIRHLVMPGHLECCAKPALEWAAAHFPATPVHLMFQYVPDFRAKGDPVLGRPLSAEEIARAQTLAQESGALMYKESTAIENDCRPDSAEPTSKGIGDTVDILVHADGRVAFTRLLESLIPIAHALNEGDSRLSGRLGVP